MKISWKYLLYCTLIILFDGNGAEKFLPDKDIARQDTTLAQDDNYRLPKSIEPSSYEINLMPKLEEDFKFSGIVKITAKVKERTNNIILHVGNIEILAYSILVEGQPINAIWTSYNNETEQYSLTVPGRFELDKEILIAFTYNGILSDNRIGFYKSSYNEGGITKWFAATQFQSTHARHAFPCFDEPNFKAKFTIRILRDQKYTCLSNMPLNRTDILEDGEIWDVFEESVPMPTYLVAFIISEFHNLSQTPERDLVEVWARPDVIEQARFASKIASYALNWYSKEFDQAHEFRKLDMAAIPDFYAGAMENWGLVTYREARMLYDENESSAPAQHKVAATILHELSHTWFGNMLTPEWWGYLWLSEGFARYYQYFGTVDLFSAWKMEDQFVVEQHQIALIIDSVQTSLPMTRKVSSKSQVAKIGDDITYAKGASIVRMMDLEFGADIFRPALQAYIKNNKEAGLVNPDALWSAIQSEINATNVTLPTTVKTIMETWTTQAGYPVVNITVNGNIVHLTQQRFLLRNWETLTDETWWIPLTWATQDQPNFDDTTPKRWMSTEEREIELTIDPEKWIIFNVQSSGFYRVNYEEKEWLRIFALNIDNIPVLSRAVIVDDLLNLGRGGYQKYETVLNCITYLIQEKDYLPFKAALNSFDHLNKRFEGNGDEQLFKNFVLSLIRKRLSELGFEDRDGDDVLTILLRQELSNLACNLGNKNCIQHYLEKFREWKENDIPIKPNERTTAYRTAIRYGNNDDWEFLWNKYNTSNYPTDKTVIMNALGCSNNRTIIEKYLTYAITNYNTSGIHKQDSTNVFAAVYNSGITGAEYVLDFVDKFSEEMKTYYEGPDQIVTILDGASQRFSTLRLIEKFAKVVNKFNMTFETISESLKSSLEIARKEFEWYNQNSIPIIQWLLVYNRPDESIKYRLSKNVVPSKYEISVTPNFETGEFSGNVKIIVKTLEDIRHLFLHAAEMTIENVKINNGYIWEIMDIFETQPDYELLIIDMGYKIGSTQLTIEISYTGTLSPSDLRGFYRSSYMDGNKQTRYLAATHLEPTSARKMFPCFDEPAMKARFKIFANVPPNYHAVSNMKVENIIEKPDGRMYIFHESEVMSTYLVAVIISDFKMNPELTTNPKFAVLARPNAIGQTEHALKSIEPLVEFFQMTYRRPYQLEKLYMAALPDFPSGAGENWGLLAYRESNLLYDENHSTITSKQAIRNVIAHEISHQWFGNLVTPEWWDYLWLNEGFARYFEYHATARSFNDATLEPQFVVDEIHSALSVDSSGSTHPLTHTVSTVSEIQSIFDTITYAKGASILRMLEKSFGTQLFNDALSDYLKLRSYKTVIPKDLYAAFQNQIDFKMLPYNATDILETWTAQPGYPVVNVYIDATKTNIIFEQERFFLKKEENHDTDLLWRIPITWTLIDSYSEYDTKPKLWLEEKNITHTFRTPSLFMCNTQRSGYYRVNYDKDYLLELINYFTSENTINPINEVDRAVFIDDLMNLARAGSYNADYKDVLSATMYLTQENNYLPWRAFFDNLPYLNNRFRGRHIEELYKKYLTHLIEPLYNRLTFMDGVNDDELTKMLRMHARKWACELNIGDCVYEAINSFNDAVPNSRAVSYCMIMKMDKTGNSYDYFLQKYINSNVASEQLDILRSLACSMDLDVLNKLLEEAIKTDSSIRSQDSARVFSNVYSENLIGVEAVINFIQTRYKDMMKYFGFAKVENMVSSLAGRLSTHDIHEKYNQLITMLSGEEDFKNFTESYLSAAKYEFEWYEKNVPLIYEQLYMLFSSEPAGHRLPKTLYPELYTLQIIPYMEEGTFNGTVEISMTAAKETTLIILNSHKLEISNIKVFKNGKEIKILSHTWDDVTQLLKIHLAELINVNDTISAKMDFKGVLNDNMRGFYRSSYIENGLQHWLATTQFEPIYARDAFPCFDEPEFKAKFKISIQRPMHYNSLSNMPLERTIETDKFVLDEFKVTDVKVPIYSVAFVISEFEPVDRGNNVDFNVWGRPQIAKSGEYAQDLARVILNELENMTEIDYPLPKLDLVGIPDLNMIAMENWGLVTSREYGLFYNKRVTTATYEKHIIAIITHELVHMWFGNLVTCEWWDYIWLNEGFAKYYEWVVADKIKPEYKFMDQFVVYELQPALLVDSSASGPPMTNPVATPEEISGIFNYVTYGKSACVLRMLFNAIEEEAYKSALRYYLNRQREVGTANPSDLWKSFDPFVTIDIGDRHANIEEVMSTWTDQPGYPVVNATLDSSTLTLTQERFVIDKQSNGKQFYWIPISIVTSLDSETYMTMKRQFWLGPEPQTTYINPTNEWFIVNYKQTGFYRVNYDADSWARLIDGLNSDRFENIHVLNRAQIIDDLFNLAAASYVDYELLLEASKYLVNEKNHLPWKAFFNGLSYVYERFEGQNYQENLQNYILYLTSTMYSEVGFEDSNDEEHLNKLNREIFLQWACKLNNNECIKKSKDLFNTWLENIPVRVPLNARPAVYCTAVEKGTTKEWNFLWERYRRSNFESEKKIILTALGCSKDEEILQNYLKEAIKKYNPGKATIQRQDASMVFSSVYSASPLGVNVVLDFLMTNITEVYDYFGNWNEIANLFLTAASHVSDNKQYEKLQQFVESNTYKQFSRDIGDIFDSAVMIAENNLLWYEKYGKLIGEWVKKNMNDQDDQNDNGTSARLEPMNVIFITLIVSYFLSYLNL